MRHISLFILLMFAFKGMQSQTTDSLKQDTYRLYLEALDDISAYQFDHALETLSECYIREPENMDYLSRIAYCHTQLGRSRDAKLYYSKMLKLDSLNAIAMSSLGALYEKEFNYTRAREFYSRLIEIDTSNSYYFKRNGYLALRVDKPLEALTHFSRAYRLNDKDLEVIDMMCSIYLALGAFEPVEGLLQQGLNLDGKNIKLLQTKARLMQKLKDHEAVVEAIEKTMVQGDTSDYYQMMIGVAYLKIDSVDKAIEHLSAIVKRGEDSEHTHHYLGLAYLEKEALDSSAVHLEKAAEMGISEKMGTYHADLARVKQLQYKYKEAINHFEEAYAYSDDPEHLFHMARNCDLYYKDKRIANKYYQRYLATGNEKFKQYTLDRMKQLREIIHFQGN